ncbi:MAG: hypothetical protein ACKOQM_14455 [Novosphingobium sp.]
MRIAPLSTSARILTGFGLLAYAAMAAGSAADRLSKDNPALAARVPSLFASEALRTLGADALANGKAVAAAKIGEVAIRDAPTDPQSTALFGAGKFASGNRPLADRAFRVAGQLGWRVPITQSYWMGQALTAGKYDLAALRLDALLRQQPELLRQRQLTDPMERNPAGQAAMIARMRANPVWLGFYAGDVESLPADAGLQRADVLGQAARSGIVLGCDRIAPLASRLAVVGKATAGSALWRQHCLEAGSGLVSDGQLATLDITARPSAFSWELIGNSELALSILPAGNGHGKRLVIDGLADVTRPVIAQNLVLAPGRYVLIWRTGSPQGQASDHLLAGLACQGEPPVWAEASLDRASGLWNALVEARGTCPLHRLTFAAAPRSGQVWLEQIELKPAN